LPGQGTATVVVPGNPPVPDIAIAPGQYVPGVPPSQTTVTRPTFLSGFISSLGPALEGAMKAPRGSGFAGGIAGGFAGIEEQNRYDQNLAMQRTEQERKSLLEQSTLLNQQSETALRNAEIQNYARKPADKFLTTFADASGNQTALFQSPSGSPYTVKVGAAKLADEMQPLGPSKVGQLNDALAMRWNVLNQGTAPPSAFMLKPDATQKDFERVDKILEATEKARGTKTQQDEVRALREQTAAIAQAGKAEKPVVGYDRKTGQRVLSTAGDYKGAGLTNPVSVSESDIEKESAASRQFNDVQMNVSRYKNAVEQASGISNDDMQAITRALSSEKFTTGAVNQIPGIAIRGEERNEMLKAAGITDMSPEAQDVLFGYLRAKGSIVAFQKALTQVGRTSKEALEIEMNNLPSPVMGTTAAGKQLEAFQENIDTASQGLTKVPWLESPKDVRARIEGQGQAQAKAKQDAANKATGQYTDPQKSHKVGQEVIFKGKQMTITKIYRDGSFDME